MPVLRNIMEYFDSAIRIKEYLIKIKFILNLLILISLYNLQETKDNIQKLSLIKIITILPAIIYLIQNIVVVILISTVDKEDLLTILHLLLGTHVDQFHQQFILLYLLFIQIMIYILLIICLYTRNLIKCYLVSSFLVPVYISLPIHLTSL